MTEFPFPTGWMPWPQRLYPGRARRLAALTLLALALAGVVWTLMVWRADSADRHEHYAAAVFWRPGVAAYHRHWGESLLLTAPAAAETQFLAALRLDPYDPLTIADLTTTELALGNWPQAVVTNQRRLQRKPDFTDYWRLANLFLAHGDLAGYWQEFQLAAALALPDDFPSIVSRSLTASGQDFTRLRQALPPASVPAASAYLAAASAAGNLEAVNDGAAWLASLPPPAAPVARAARRQAMMALVLRAWQRWPGDAARLGALAATMGVLPSPGKAPSPPFIRDGSFNPAAYAAARRWSPDPTSDLSALVGWQTLNVNNGEFDEVLTGEAEHPTAAEIILSGTEPDNLVLAQQKLLVQGGATLQVSAAGRLLDGLDALDARDAAPAPGLSLQLLDAQQRTLATLPLSLQPGWQQFTAAWPIAGSGVQALQLAVSYHRPKGNLPLRARALLTAVRLQ